jgi:hypothetical protein
MTGDTLAQYGLGDASGIARTSAQDVVNKSRSKERKAYTLSDPAYLESALSILQGQPSQAMSTIGQAGSTAGAASSLASARANQALQGMGQTATGIAGLLTRGNQNTQTQPTTTLPIQYNPAGSSSMDQYFNFTGPTSTQSWQNQWNSDVDLFGNDAPF